VARCGTHFHRTPPSWTFYFPLTYINAAEVHEKNHPCGQRGFAGKIKNKIFSVRANDLRFCTAA
jgi:hypothetical protein